MHLIGVVFTLLPTYSYFPQPTAPGNHVSNFCFYHFDIFKRFHIWLTPCNICFCLVYFIQHNILKVYPYCCKWQDSLLSNGWVIFHYIRKLHLYLSLHRNLGGFHTLAIVKMQQWIWELRYVSDIFSFPLDIYPEMVLLDHMAILFFLFFEEFP